MASRTDRKYPISKRQRLTLMDVIDILESVSTISQFAECLDGEMQRLFPHEMFVCGIGNVEGPNVIPRHLFLNHFPMVYMESLRQPDGGFNSALIERWRATREPVLVELEHDVEGWPEDWVRNAKEHGFRDFAEHGFLDIQGAVATIFCFSGMPGRLTEVHAYLLCRLVPYLHVALVRAATTCGNEDAESSVLDVVLTQRQKEVLHWLRCGKTNWEIAAILGTSQETVKSHVSELFRRLNVTNRTQAVYVANMRQLR